MQRTIIQAIKDDHRILRKAFKDVGKLRDALSGELSGAYRKLRGMNEVHMKNEERYFYEPLKLRSASRADALESLEEHHILRIIEQELDGIRMDDERWKAKYALLAELSSRHFDEEEENLFKLLQKEVKRDRQLELGRQFEEDEGRAGVPELAGV